MPQIQIVSTHLNALGGRPASDVLPYNCRFGSRGVTGRRVDINLVPGKTQRKHALILLISCNKQPQTEHNIYRQQPATHMHCTQFNSIKWGSRLIGARRRPAAAAAFEMTLNVVLLAYIC